MRSTTKFGCLAVAGMLVSLCGCKMADEDSTQAAGSVRASLEGVRCADVASRTAVGVRGSLESEDKRNAAYAHGFVDCSLDQHACSCTAETACLAVVRQKLSDECEKDRSARWHIAQDVTAEFEHCHQLCTGKPSFDLQACAESVPVRTDLTGRAREIAYQVDIGSYCGAAGSSTCTNELIAIANVDYSAAALQVAGQQMTPAQYLALSRDRTRKLRAAEGDVERARSLCEGRDSDGDWVLDSVDHCPNTPDLTATDDSGCPLTTLPPAPSADDILAGLSRMNLWTNPHCSNAPVPQMNPGGAFYLYNLLLPGIPNSPLNPDLGNFILTTAVTNQPAGCPVWYQFEIEETTGTNAGSHYDVVYMDREATTNLVEQGLPVPEGFLQFNPRPSDSNPQRARLGGAGYNGTFIRFRVRAMNAIGLRSVWSDYKNMDATVCRALGLQCGQ